jgi:hypothetical protein
LIYLDLDRRLPDSCHSWRASHACRKFCADEVRKTPTMIAATM